LNARNNAKRPQVNQNKISTQPPATNTYNKVLSAQEIIDQTMAGFNAAIDNLHQQYGQ
jgi:capsular polysaccharide biosynthesis protein